MSDVRSTALPFPEDAQVDTRSLLIQVERAAADAVSKFKPGRLSSTAVHRVLERLVLTDRLMEEASSRVSHSAKSGVARHLHAGSLIEDAIKKTNAAHARLRLRHEVSGVVGGRSES